MTTRAQARLSKRTGEGAVAGVLALVSAGIVWEAWRMPPGTLGSPGPGVFPLILASLLGAVSLGLVIRAARAGTPSEAVSFGHPRIWLALAALVGLALLFEPAGYVPAGTLFLLVLFRAFSPLGSIGSLLAAAASSVVSYLFFVRLLGVSLPPGLLPLH